MTAYYTGKGDDGTTGILSARRVGKDDVLIDAIGNLDELNSAIGVALAYINDKKVEGRLASIQNTIFILGANIASTNEKKIDEAQIRQGAEKELEEAIVELSGSIQELRQFVLPGGVPGSAQLHMARTIARRCERSVVTASREYKIDREVIAYLNRLSSYLFVAALYINHSGGVEERHPTY